MEAISTQLRDVSKANTEDHIAPYFETARHVIEHEFPFEFFVAGELAQFETFSIPTMSKILHRTRQYENDGLKRIDDTKANLYPVFIARKDDADRAKFVEHMNWIHSHYDIKDEDYVYTLIRMFLHPIEWVNKWGRRPLTQVEIDALIAQVYDIGVQMNIKNIPSTYEAMQRWQAEYRAKHEYFHQDNADVAQGMMRGLELHFPRMLRPLVEPAVTVVLDNDILTDALGLKRPSMFHKIWVHGLLKTWKLFSKVYRPWKHKKFSESRFVTGYFSYPDGIDYCKMGPEKLLKARDKTGKCPFH